MAVSREDLDRFYQFAQGKLESGSSELNMTDLVDLWRIENPSAEEHAENVAAICEALNDMRAGDRGRPVQGVLDELRSELNSASE